MKRSLVVVTGARGTGKTTFLSTYLAPDDLLRCYYVDTEYSANNIVDQLAEHGLSFGRYVNVQDRFSNLPGERDLLNRIVAGKLPWVSNQQRAALADFYVWLLEDMNEHLKLGKYTQVVIDTLEKFEAGMLAYVEGNKRETGWSVKADGKLWTDAYYPLYEGLISSLYQRGVEVVMLSSHLRNPWVDRRPVPGKVSPGGKKILYQLSQLFLWMVNEPSNISGAPAALVLKERVGKHRPVEGGWKLQRTLPRRLPIATWEAIRNYMQDPADLSNPKSGEVPSANELDMISELLTDAQMRLMVLGAEKELAEAQAERPLLQVEQQLPQEPVAVAMDENLSRAVRIRDDMPSELPEADLVSAVSKILSIPLPVAVQLVKQLPPRIF